MTILCILAFLYAFWIAYIGVMGIYRAYLDHRLSATLLVLLTPFVLAGLLMDVFANIFIATVVFWEFPREWLVTQRLIRYIKSKDDTRAMMASFICSNLLDLFDPTGRHCA
jgi:hypothetical protein